MIDPAEATGVVHLAIGPDDIDVWRAKPGAREVARTDPRTPRERAEYQRLRTQVIDELGAAGLADLVPTVDDNLFGLSLNTRVPDVGAPEAHSDDEPGATRVRVHRPTRGRGLT